jgi:imidazolonepropionase-like amidohydrolase
MKWVDMRMLRVAAALTTFGSTVVAQRVPSQISPLQRAGDTLAFVNVNVIPMDRERTLAGQTVIVAGGRIAALGLKDSIRVPASATRVDGHGRLFVIPGLADMHTHLRYDSDLRLLIANGVTTVRNMNSTPAQLELRRRIAEGTVLGPRIITGGPRLGGDSNRRATPAETRAAVESQAAAGYDFIKPYDFLPKDSYEAAVTAAAEHHLPIAGHVPGEVGVLGVLGAHQVSIEHAEQIIYHYFAPNTFMVRAEHLDTARLPVIARAIADAGTYVTPTLTTIHSLVLQWEHPDSVLARPEIKYIDPETYAWWRTDRGHSSAITRVMEPFFPLMMRAFRDAGVRMLAGTDYYLFGLTPGFGVHRELQTLVQAGLSPFEALETATRNPAEFLGEASDAGTVAVGKVANLVVLDANPLVDVRNAMRRTGVVVRGRWLPAKTLDGWLDSLTKAFAPEDRLVDEALAPGGGTKLAARKDSIPPFQRSTLALVADALLAEKRFDDAVGVCELLAQRYATEPSSFNRLGDAYAGANQKEPAIRAYETAIRLGAMMADAIRNKIERLRRP